MARIIKLGVWEKNDLLRLLDYAQQKKLKDYDDNKLTYEEYRRDLKTIWTLKERLRGKDYKQDYELQSAKYTGSSVEEEI